MDKINDYLSVFNPTIGGLWWTNYCKLREQHVIMRELTGRYLKKLIKRAIFNNVTTA